MTKRPARVGCSVFDVVGGRYDELDYTTTGSGGLEARSFLKNRWQDDLDEAGAVALAVEALVAAAEEDAATGGPDPKRGIYPNVIVVSDAGVTRTHRRRTRSGRGDGAGGSTMTAPFYVPPEQLVKDRADFARKGIGRGRPIVVVHRPRTGSC